MNRNIGTPIHHTNLKKGRRYFLKHDLLGEALVEYVGRDDFKMIDGKLKGQSSGMTWSRGDMLTLPLYDGAHFYQPIL